MSWVIAVVASVIAGFVSALGLGGGGILILYLTLFLDMGQKQAGGINLIFFLPIAAVSIFIHVKNKMIDYKFALKWVGKAFAVLVLILGIKELFSKTPPKEKDTE